MKMTFVGCGSAFTDNRYYQSNMLITSVSGKKLLIDCGGDIRFSLGELGITNGTVGDEIDALYLSHLHSDHVSGCEWLGFCTYFNPKQKRPTLFIVNTLVKPLWNTLKGGMQSIEGKVCGLQSYFDVQSISINGSFTWEGINFIPVQTVHIMNGMGIVPSYGLLFNEIGDNKVVFLTTDTQFCPRQIEKFYKEATWIFQDCETSPFKSGVHAHYDDLKTLSPDIKRKMWLYHYQPDPKQNPQEDGFEGFVTKGQTFDFHV